MTATGLVIRGLRVEVPGIPVENWHDNPAWRLRMPNDGRSRLGSTINAVVIHSTHGKWPQEIRPGTGPKGNAAEANLRYWTLSDKNAGAHLIIDFDGQVICTADLALEEAYHAESVNDVTVGIELVQGESGYFYQRQYDVLLAVVDVATAVLGIQRQVQAQYYGSAKPIPRLHAGGRDCIGVYQHRDQTSNRGRGDAGDHVTETFLFAGYETVDFAAGTDLEIWKVRQKRMNDLGATLKVDGVAGKATTKAVERYFDRDHGLWVVR